MIIEAIEELIGPVPQGFEPLQYIVAALFVLFVLVQVFSFFKVLFRNIL